MFTTPKKVASRLNAHPYLSPFKLFRNRGSPTVSSPSSSPARQAFDSATPSPYSPLMAHSPTPRKRYRAPGDVPASPSPRVARNTPNYRSKGHHRVGGRVNSQNSLRKERSFRSLQKEHYYPVGASPGPSGYGHVYSTTSSATTSSSSVNSTDSEFTNLAQDVNRTFAAAKVPMTAHERVFTEQFQKLGVNFVIATGFVDPQRAEDAAPVLSTKLHDERVQLLEEIEVQRKRHDAAIREGDKRAAEKKARLAREEREMKQRQAREQAQKDAEAKEMQDRMELQQRTLAEARRTHEEKEKERMEAQRQEEKRRQDADAMLRRERVRLARENDAKLEEERQARFAERQRREELERHAERQRIAAEEANIAAAAAELRAQQETHARLVAEEDARQSNALLQAQQDEIARLEMERRIREMLDEQARALIDDRFREHEARARAQIAQAQAEYEARMQAEIDAANQASWNEWHRAQLQQQEEYQRQQQQQYQYEQQQRYHYEQQQQYQQYQQQQAYADNDIPMGEPSFRVDIMDSSMASIPSYDDEPISSPSPPPSAFASSPSPSPTPEPECDYERYIPPPTPRSQSEWFSLYDAKWFGIRTGNSSSSTSTLTFGHFPWPVFRFINSLDELVEAEIRAFFEAKYPGVHGKLLRDKNWKDDLRRWHTDKFAQVKMKVKGPGRARVVRDNGDVDEAMTEADQVSEGFLRCIKVMNGMQGDRDVQ